MVNNTTSEKQETAEQYDYLIIGGGMAAGYAVKGIREEDKTGTIGILSAESDVPYERPALSKKLWTDKSFTEEQISIGAEKEKNVTIKLETPAAAIDRENHTVQLENGTAIGYKKLLLATGGKPATIDGPDDDRVIVFRDESDYRRLRKLSGSGQQVLVIGGGYIGAELAAALIQNNTRVTLIYPDDLLGSKQFPEEIAQEYEDAFREAGVELLNNSRAKSYAEIDGKLTVFLEDGKEPQGDAAVIGLGVSPRTSLAEKSGLEVTDGVVVDEHLRTSDPAVWAAGDIASYPDKILGRTRIEHVDHARHSGKTAGRILAGSDEAYTRTPYFYSDVFSISWEAIGKLDASLTTLIDEVDGGKVVYYLDKGRLVGILLWNVDASLNSVRKILSDPPADPQKLPGAIRSRKN